MVRSTDTTAAKAISPDISHEFIAGLAELLVPACYGGLQAPWSAILDPVRRTPTGGRAPPV